MGFDDGTKGGLNLITTQKSGKAALEELERDIAQTGEVPSPVHQRFGEDTSYAGKVRMERTRPYTALENNSSVR